MAGGTVGVVVLLAAVFAAALATGVSLGEGAAQPLAGWRVPPLPSDPRDGEPHLLIHLAANGRPNPAQYERFADYPAALARQRALHGQGRGAVVMHSASGEIRVDMEALTTTWRRMMG
jgi:hypothetical protein